MTNPGTNSNGWKTWFLSIAVFVILGLITLVFDTTSARIDGVEFEVGAVEDSTTALRLDFELMKFQYQVIADKLDEIHKDIKELKKQ